MKVGYKRTLTPEDMYYLTDDLKVDHLASKFYVNFDMQLQKARRKHLMKKCKERGETIEKYNDTTRRRHAGFPSA